MNILEWIETDVWGPWIFVVSWNFQTIQGLAWVGGVRAAGQAVCLSGCRRRHPASWVSGPVLRTAFHL